LLFFLVYVTSWAIVPLGRELTLEREWETGLDTMLFVIGVCSFIEADNQSTLMNSHPLLE
jgi:hypothetical protein